MAPPHLHPRSRSTSSLFVGTLLASFAVVALPHLLPCPAPRVKFADSDPSRPRRRRRKEATSVEEEASATDGNEPKDPSKRECPVPKPGAIMSGILGLGGTETKEQAPEVMRRERENVNGKGRPT